MNSTFGGYISTALSNTSWYDESGVLVPSQAPYQLYTSSFSGYSGDFNATNYDYTATYDLTDNYAYITSSPAGDTWLPPTSRVAPGWLSGASGPGVEWRIDPVIFCSASLSCTTAANAGILAWLRFLHPTWNWFDTKAALRQNGSNWATGYSTAAYGFGLVDHVAASTLTDGQILLQPPAATVTTSAGRISFTVYPFKSTRRVKEVLFQFASAPSFQANELTLNDIQTLGGTKITEYTGTTATTTTPIYPATTNAYFVWLTADSASDASANFSRIDTYTVLGPVSQNEISFNGTFDIVSPADNTVAGSSPTFSWGAVDSYLGVAKYQLYIDGVLDTDNILGTSATPTTPLADGSHTWYVKAFNGGGATLNTTSTPTVNILSGYVSGYTFYVDNVLGNDANSGTQASPWLTLAKAGATVSGGDSVVIVKNAGVPYRETLTPAQAGASGSPVTFRGADASSKPEIWGSDDVSGSWSVYGGGNADTFQKTLAQQTWILATGPSIDSLVKRPEGSSKTSLNPGEWISETSAPYTLYYRLASGENISTLHIEADVRGYGINGTGYQTFQDIIVRYVHTAGINLRGTGSVAHGIEAYDSYEGITLGANAVPTLRYCVSVGNDQYGIVSGLNSSPGIYNSLIYGNAGGGVQLNSLNNNITLRNNISVGNSGYPFLFYYYFGTPTVTASNNAWDIAGDSYWDIHKGSNNQELVSPLFQDESSYNFQFAPLSPNIDTGISVAGLTADILGNPLYGTPDIGPYEYQPPYSMGTHAVDIAADVRVYGDGKFRNTRTAGGTAADLSVIPQGGQTTQWLDISKADDESALIWETDHKKWKESSSTLGTTNTLHTIGGLTAGKIYAIRIDDALAVANITGTDCDDGLCTADDNGDVTFTYTGGYSAHTFEVTKEDDIERKLNIHNVAMYATENAIVITWKTDYATKSTIRFGENKNIRNKKVDNKKEKKHRAVLVGLFPGTRYYFRINVKDGDGNEDASKLHSIKTAQRVAVIRTPPSQQDNQRPSSVETGDKGSDALDTVSIPENKPDQPHKTETKTFKWWNPFTWFAWF